MPVAPAAPRNETAQEQLARSLADIGRFFGPMTGIALVGKVDTSPFFAKRLQRFGDGIDIAFVNPKGPQDGGPTVYRSVLDLPDHFNVVIVRTPPAHVPGVVEQCAQRGVRNVLVFTSGFSETGEEGARLEAQLAAAAAAGDVRLIGPNTNENCFERFTLPEGHRGGLIGLITQSGFNGRPIVEGVHLGAGFRRWVTTGNEIDLEFADFVNFFAHDPEAAVIAGYIEGFRSGPKLRAALEAANAQDKPVVVLKIGSTDAGARMAASHTGHLAGGDAAADGLFRQHGVTRVHDLDELLETANLFSKLPLDTGPACALYSVSGGSATLMAEHADACGLPIPALSAETQAALHAHLPHYLTVSNPIDNGGQFVISAPPAARMDVLDRIAADPAVDMVVVGLTAAYGPLSDGFAADIRAWAARSPKPVVAIWGSVVSDTQGFRDLVASGVPVFRSFRNCFKALKAFSEHRQARASFRVRPPQPSPPADIAPLLRPGVMAPADATALLTAAGLPMVREVVAADAAAAQAFAEQMAGPVVMKIASADFPHKSDLGLVQVGVPPEQAAAMFGSLVQRAQAADSAARIDGVLMQEQVPAGIEMLVGLTVDPVLGPALTVGAGGVQAELLKDVAVRPLPVDRRDVAEMIDSLRMAPLLRGYRGGAAADVEALIDVAMAAASLAQAGAGTIAELDLNPVIVTPQRAVAVDALVVCRGG